MTRTVAVPQQAASPTVEALRLERVSFTYPETTTPALRDVSLTVRQGEMVVIMGASGAGKSTLVKCLNRVIPAFQTGHLTGDMFLFGQRLTHEKVGELAGTVGMVFQDFEAQLFSTTVRDEVIFGMEQLGVDPALMQARLEAVLARVGLSGFEGRDPTTLSGGQKQRLAIAALLALQPRLLVLDEPTTDLDPQGRQEIFTLLGQMRANGHTLVLVEHEISAAIPADRVILLAAGAMVAEGPPEQILPQTALLERYGVRPRDSDRVFQHFGITTYVRSVAEAAATLRPHWSGSAAKPAVPFPSTTRLRHETSAAPLLEVQAVTHNYGEGAAAVREVTLTIHAGEFLALLGKNGSGKTTLAKHLGGLLTPTHGRVLLRGQELSQVPLHQFAQEVSYVFQNPDHQLFADTVEAEVAFGPRNIGLAAAEVRARVDEALDAVGLQSLRDQDPFLLGRGERQRLAVAALLALRPRMLILDEPTTGLDYPEQRQMMDLLKRFHQEGRTILIITHAPWVAAEYAERALLMAEGQLLWDGSLRALCAQPDLCAQAAFRPPDCTLLGGYFGEPPLSVEELVGSVKRKA
ncbi:MAG: ABC transporter ATP-binding protein [Deltaproteobacteria bacterium]|nr:ABC transporter ATP-binding protein [Deltaproteobacteria bacterium]